MHSPRPTITPRFHIVRTRKKNHPHQSPGQTATPPRITSFLFEQCQVRASSQANSSLEGREPVEPGNRRNRSTARQVSPGIGAQQRQEQTHAHVRMYNSILYDRGTGHGKTGLCAVMITIAMSRMGLRIRPICVCVCETLGRPGPGREAAEQESIDLFQITGADTIWVTPLSAQLVPWSGLD
jgi:hypothetical protein